MPSNKEKARAAVSKQNASPHETLKKARKQQGFDRNLWIAIACVVVLCAALGPQFLSSDAAASEKSSLLKKSRKKHLQPIEAYGISAYPEDRSLIADKPCPIEGHNGSVLDCFFTDLFYDIAAEEPDLGHSDSSLGFQGTYGEITPTGVNKLFDLLHVDVDDTFYDLGSGTGKVVLQAFLTTPCRKAAGIELSETRHATATKAKSIVLKMLTRETDTRLHFQQGDASLVPIDDATIVFMCSLCFPDEVMRKLAWHIASVAQPGTIVLSLKPFEDNPGLSLFGYIPLPMTWTERFEMLAYIVTPRMAVVKPLLGYVFANSSRSSWRRMFRASVMEDVHSIVVESILARSQTTATADSNATVSIESSKFLFDMDGRSAPKGIVNRFFLLAGTFAIGKLADRTQLAFNHKVKNRARELAVNAVGQVSEIPVADLASFALARVQGDTESIMDCIVGDLWPRVLPKLSPEEAKLAVGPGAWQLEMSSWQLQQMLDLITPPLGKDDVLVEMRSGAGQLIMQARMTTDVKKAIGIEAVPSRVKMASDVTHRIEHCDEKAPADKKLVCPLALSALVDVGLDYLLEEDSIQFMSTQDPLNAVVVAEGASVMYSLTQGWPRGALWHFAAKSTTLLPTGEIVIGTSMWPGCQRGLLEVVAKDLEADRWSGGRHIMSWTASVNLVMPVASSTHPLFTSGGDHSNTALRDLLLQRLGISNDFFHRKGSTWRTHMISFEQVIEVLLNFGPPFSTRVAPKVDQTLLHSRFEAMIKRYLTEKSRRRVSLPNNVTGSEVSLHQMVDILGVALHGDAQTPIECLASDLDILKEHREQNLKKPSTSKQSGQGVKSESVYRNCAASGELRPLAVIDLMNHHMLKERFDDSSAAIVVGDCRAAAFLVMLRNGPRNVRCLELQSSDQSFEGPLEDLNSTYPGFLHGRHFEQGTPASNGPNE
jgi:SAM-dependent methyltransferase